MTEDGEYASPPCDMAEFAGFLGFGDCEGRVRLLRVYDAKDDEENDCRILVDRVWPRGVSKAQLRLDLWLKELAPPTKLRQWFGHKPERWVEFCRRYYAWLREDAAAQKALGELKERLEKGPVALLFAARDRERNNAVALKRLLEAEG